MRWGGLAAVLLLAAQTKEEKGKLIILVRGESLGEESFRLESFDDGRLACFSKSAASDAVLTLDSKSLRPRLYAAVHKAGKSETEIKLEWKDGRIAAKIRRDGKETARELKVTATALFDENCLSQLIPIVRRFKDGKNRLKVLAPVTLEEIDAVVEDRGTVELKGRSLTLKAHRWTITIGSLSADYYEDADRLPLLIGSGERRAAREGFENAAPANSSGESEVAFASGKLRLTGAFTRPAGTKLPAVVLIADAGPHDRDDLKAIAAALAAEGVASLRYDKRDLARATLSDLVADVAAAVAYLRGRDDVDPDRIGLVGHGEGGTIAAIVASRDAKIRAVFLLAAPGKSLDAVFLDRLDARLRDEGTSDDQRREILADERSRLDRIKKSERDTMAIDEKETFIGGMRENFNHDPAACLSKVRAFVLVLQGLADREVFAENSDLLESAMKEGAKENFEVLRLEGLDHRFQRDGAADAAFLKTLAGRAAKSLK